MATNGFFGKVKAFFGGKSSAKDVSKIAYIKGNGREKRRAEPTAHGRKTTTGAFGGTGTGRGMRGMPGRKLIKKTVKSGWKAHNCVTLSTKPVQKSVTGGKS
jgi:hypothetical protein